MEPMTREAASCTTCGSTVRLRGLAALLCTEFFGTPLALPDLPDLKGLRGFGMSDPPNLAKALAARFDYSNTFYHQPPTIDITAPDASEVGRYDFIVSSEVMEHVPPPVEAAFANLYRLLKPNGVLLLTVPYTIDRPTQEHFPELHQHALVNLGGKTVLVNKRRDGVTEFFENLCFHGGDGSTLEQRILNEETLLRMLRGAGFDDVRVASESIPQFGVEHIESWSLPIVARKGKVVPPVAGVARAYAAAVDVARQMERELEVLQGEYERFVAFHNQTHQESEQRFAALAHHSEQLTKENNMLREEASRAAELEGKRWVRLGRSLGTIRGGSVQRAEPDRY
jgi:SAM-dependent methyltransferase